MKTISREELNERLANDGITLVEVLAPKYYKKFHLPGAINVPLDDDFDEQIQKAVPDKDRTVVVYCHDAECQASPKAARRMDELGYRHVLDYEDGKMDWKTADLPIES
jgi:rhodanese-related sulfurtransferase